MWKLCSADLLLSSLALAQSAAPNATPAGVNPLAGAKLWPKVQPRRFPPVAAAVPYIRLNDLEPGPLPGSGHGLDGIWSYNRFNPVARNFGDGTRSFYRSKPATPQAGRCAIPLLQLQVPSDRNFAMQQILPPDIDDLIVSPPPVPACTR